VDLDVGTGRHLPGRAHSLVRDGGAAPAVIDTRWGRSRRNEARKRHENYGNC
jgi:hypothetical protein